MRQAFANPPKNKTWFWLWMEMRELTVYDFSRMLLYSERSVTRWRAGCTMTRRVTNLILALYPDCPVPRIGGRLISMTEPIPTNARTNEFYKFFFTHMVKIEKMDLPGNELPKTIEEARRRALAEPGQGAVLPSEPDSKSV